MKTESRLTRSLWSWPAPVRYGLIALVTALLGVGLGLSLMTPAQETLASLILVGFCVLIALLHPLEGVLLALALLPFENFFYLNIKLGESVPDINLSRLVVGLVFVLLLARAATGRVKLQALTLTDVVMALTVLGLGVSAVRGLEVVPAFQVLIDRYLVPYVLYFVAKNEVRDRADLKKVLWAVAVIGLYNAAYGIYTQTTGQVLFVEGGRLQGITEYTNSLRIMRGLLDAPHIFGLVFSLAIPIDFFLLLKAERLNRQLLALLLLTMTTAALFLTYKRTAWIATMASFFVIQFFFPRFRRLFLVLSVAVIGVMWLYGDEINDSTVVTERVGAKVDSLNGRTELWDEAIAAWTEAPFLGYGRGRYLAQSSSGIIESHYLDILVDAGLVGFVPFLLVFGLLLVNGLRLYRARGAAIFVDPEIAAIFLGVVVAYLVSLYTVVMNHPFPHQLFFLLAGAVVGSQEAALDQPRRAEVNAPAPAPAP